MSQTLLDVIGRRKKKNECEKKENGSFEAAAGESKAGPAENQKTVNTVERDRER